MKQFNNDLSYLFFDLFEVFIAESEVVADFMEYHFPDLFFDLPVCGATPLDGLLEDGDDIRRDVPVKGSAVL